MEKRTIDKIKQIADFIVIDRSDGYITKSIKMVYQAKYADTLRKFLVKLVTENYKAENATALITVNDYSDYLFPDGGNWIEIKYLLLISIYEKLHEINKIVNTEILEDAENELETLK